MTNNSSNPGPQKVGEAVKFFRNLADQLEQFDPALTVDWGYDQHVFMGLDYDAETHAGFRYKVIHEHDNFAVVVVLDWGQKCDPGADVELDDGEEGG